MGLGGGRSRLRVVKRSKDDTSICTLDTKMLFQRKDQGSDVKGPPVFGEIRFRIQTELPRHAAWSPSSSKDSARHSSKWFWLAAAARWEFNVGCW